MEKYDCDILVVGAGPAGSCAAIEASRAGVNVIIAERRSKIGIPVRCAEYIPAQLVGEVNLGTKYVVQKLEGIRTYLPDESIHEIKAPGYTINRDIFDQTLADHAETAGAKILMQAMVIGKENEEVLIRTKEKTFLKIRPKIIIGADGPYSRVGKWIESVNCNLIPAICTRGLLKNPIKKAEFYFHKDIACGYGWLFSKGLYANIGLAKKTQIKNEISLSESLRQFLKRLICEGKIISSKAELFGGWVPVEQIRNIVKENILLAGDAAGHAHPVTGAGIAFAVIGGKMAGKWAALAVKENILSLLSEYEKEWREFFGVTFNKAYQRRALMEANWNGLDSIIKRCWVSFREYYG